MKVLRTCVSESHARHFLGVFLQQLAPFWGNFHILALLNIKFSQSAHVFVYIPRLFANLLSNHIKWCGDLLRFSWLLN